MTRSILRLSLVSLTLAASSACGWLASSGDEVYLPADDIAAAERPKCRPVVEEAESPWKVGNTTPSGWAVTAVDDTHAEYVRVTFTKEAVSTTVEITYGDGTVGDWSTAEHKLMPAPDEEPPVALLEEVMAQLRAYDAGADAKPFVRRVEGVEDPYEGLPPCE